MSGLFIIHAVAQCLIPWHSQAWSSRAALKISKSICPQPRDGSALRSIAAARAPACATSFQQVFSFHSELPNSPSVPLADGKPWPQDGVTVGSTLGLCLWVSAVPPMPMISPPPVGPSPRAQDGWVLPSRGFLQVPRVHRLHPPPSCAACHGLPLGTHLRQAPGPPAPLGDQGSGYTCHGLTALHPPHCLARALCRAPQGGAKRQCGGTGHPLRACPTPAIPANASFGASLLRSPHKAGVWRGPSSLLRWLERGSLFSPQN